VILVNMLVYPIGSSLHDQPLGVIVRTPQDAVINLSIYLKERSMLVSTCNRGERSQVRFSANSDRVE
jgi:hypothetical protein